MSFRAVEIVEFWTCGLIDRDEARKMLGIDAPEAVVDCDQAFETKHAKDRFQACLHACGVQTR